MQMIKLFWAACDLWSPAWFFLCKNNFYRRCGNTCAHCKYDLSYFNSWFQSEVSLGQKTVARSFHSAHVSNVSVNRQMATSCAPPASPRNQGSACMYWECAIQWHTAQLNCSSSKTHISRDNSRYWETWISKYLHDSHEVVGTTVY